MTGKNILVIPDGHAHPGYDNTRFRYLGNYIERHRPDAIVCLGDLADMASLSSYDKGKLSGEGRRYRADIDATLDAQDELFKPFAKRRYSPKLFLTSGNHEARISKVVNDNPELEDKLTEDDLCYADYGWKVTPFKEALFYAGWGFSHYFPSGDKGYPISGVNVARQLISKNHMSSVVGHNHRLDFAEETRPDGTKVVGISAGCFAHPKMIEGWNRDTVRKWWYGVVAIDGARAGGYTGLRFISLDELTKEYA